MQTTQGPVRNRRVQAATPAARGRQDRLPTAKRHWARPAQHTLGVLLRVSPGSHERCTCASASHARDREGRTTCRSQDRPPVKPGDEFQCVSSACNSYRAIGPILLRVSAADRIKSAEVPNAVHAVHGIHRFMFASGAARPQYGGPVSNGPSSAANYGALRPAAAGGAATQSRPPSAAGASAALSGAQASSQPGGFGGAPAGPLRGTVPGGPVAAYGPSPMAPRPSAGGYGGAPPAGLSAPRPGGFSQPPAAGFQTAQPGFAPRPGLVSPVGAASPGVPLPSAAMSVRILGFSANLC